MAGIQRGMSGNTNGKQEWMLGGMLYKRLRQWLGRTMGADRLAWELLGDCTDVPHRRRAMWVEEAGFLQMSCQAMPRRRCRTLITPFAAHEIIFLTIRRVWDRK